MTLSRTLRHVPALWELSPPSAKSFTKKRRSAADSLSLLLQLEISKETIMHQIHHSKPVEPKTTFRFRSGKLSICSISFYPSHPLGPCPRFSSVFSRSSFLSDHALRRDSAHKVSAARYQPQEEFQAQRLRDFECRHTLCLQLPDPRYRQQ